MKIMKIMKIIKVMKIMKIMKIILLQTQTKLLWFINRIIKKETSLKKY